jgi:hypothetical protein
MFCVESEEDDFWFNLRVLSLRTDYEVPSQKSLKEQLERVYEALDSKYKPPPHWKKVSIQQSYYFPKINIIFTGIPKTGCSHWKELFLQAEGAIQGRLAYLPDVHEEFSDPYRLPVFAETWKGAHDQTIKTATSVVAFRNPWVRAVSAYTQKLSGESTQGNSIRWLKIAILESERSMNIKSNENSLSLINSGTIAPTFEEYVKYLVRLPRSGQKNALLENIHFKPQHAFLEVDKVRYDYIIPMEFVEPISKEFFKEVGINMSLPGSYDRVSDPRQQTSVKKARQLFSSLDQPLVEKFYEIYKIDFLLLRYSNFTDSNFPFPNLPLSQWH